MMDDTNPIENPLRTISEPVHRRVQRLLIVQLGVNDRAAAVAAAYDQGLLTRRDEAR